jgi:hypothetical protein
MPPWYRKARPVTVMCPVQPDVVDSLKATLAELPVGAESPLRKTGTTHFGRWVVIERLHDEDGMASSDELTVPYLLFTSNIDGAVDAYLHELVARSSDAMHRVWSHCIGYQRPGNDAALVAYLLGNQIRTNLFFSPYPRATVRRVSSVVNLRRSFIDFATRTDGMAPQIRRAEFRAWYDDQPKKVRR